jgi:hypothetical protein
MRLGVFLSIFVFCVSSRAIIFGQDNRMEIVFDAQKNKKLAPAIAMSVGGVYLLPQQDNTFDLDFLLATNSLTVGLCKEERFSKQYANWLNCSAFLVAPDVMVTAGHCMVFNHSSTRPSLVRNDITSMCSDFDWIFDFKANSQGRVKLQGYTDKQMARCERVMYSEISNDILREEGVFVGEYGLDFAIIKLDRPMMGRPFLKLSEIPAQIHDRLYTIGYPSGLAMKLASNAFVRENHFKNFFTADLDISSGNSGGPVFNIKNEVVGIVVRASPGEDYIWDENRKCSKSLVCTKIGEGNCPATRTDYPLGVHVQKVEPILAKLRELGIVQ